MTAGEIVGWILGGGGAGKMLYDLLKARSDARQMNAAATKDLVAAANDSAAAWQQDVEDLRGELRKLWAGQRKQDERITAHLRWDRHVAEQLRELGGTVPDPPPLYGEAA
ncbi:hypothetical protein [Amycolatopsis thermoflava]|uniref:hypothetical protein n=1 Tax=Amycolatopsis thermoflava TaxID=84480 RepID=UPI003647C0EF